MICFYGFGRLRKSKDNPRSKKSVIKINNALIASFLAVMVFLGGCASTTPLLPDDSITSLTDDYRFKSVMQSNEEIRQWARKALMMINDLQYEVEEQRAK